MQCTWLYTGPDGRSHFADLEIPSATVEGGNPAAEIVAPPGVRFTESSGGRTNDFHTAPRRQLMIMLAGVEEIECGDGSRRQFMAGDILLVDDTTGQGHMTRDLEDCRRLFIELPESFDPGRWRVAGADG